MFTVMVIEDDVDLRELFCAVLSEAGYEALEAENAAEALAILGSRSVDVVLTDVMMPDMDGFALTRTLRNAGYEFPVLIITARGRAADKQEGFRAGTDDYMVKPIDVNEMVWRVEALLRRARIIREHRITLGLTTLDSDTLTVVRGEVVIELPQKEFNLLYLLASNMGRIHTRQQIMDEIWAGAVAPSAHTLDVHISRLRERFKTNPDFEIVTVRGLGYKMVQKEAVIGGPVQHPSTS